MLVRNNKILSAFIIVMGMLVSKKNMAQFISVDDLSDQETSFSPEKLVKEVLARNCSQISNISYRGGPPNKKSYGYFKRNGTDFPIERGIILATGRARDAKGPNDENLDKDANNNDYWQGDPDIEEILNKRFENALPTHDATVLEFDFTAGTGQVSFDFVFASEEYFGQSKDGKAFECSVFQDGFAFIISGPGIVNDPGISGKNIALVPGTDEAISISSIHGERNSDCPAANEIYFIGYGPGDTPNLPANLNAPIEYNGRTTLLTAKSTVQVGEKYHIKLVVAERKDGKYDSAIFLAAESFNTGINLGSDRKACVGEVLDNATGMLQNASRQWYRDGQLLPNENNATLLLGTDDIGAHRFKSVVATDYCTYKDEVLLTISPSPTLRFEDSVFQKCPGETLTLDAGENYAEYDWSTGANTRRIEVAEAGTYRITVRNPTGCEDSATLTVEDFPEIRINNIVTTLSSLELQVETTGDYQYSLNNVTYQESPVFKNLSPGVYTIYARDKNGCGSILGEGAIIGVADFFTPNNDGYNDRWKPEVFDIYPAARVYIFDRYGKTIAQFNADSQGWDGRYLNRKLPSDDYWYRIDLGNGTTFKGHFSLIR